jgi:hypothetical protein
VIEDLRVSITILKEYRVKKGLRVDLWEVTLRVSMSEGRKLGRNGY